MRHFTVEHPNSHWAAGTNGCGKVLAQVHCDWDQARVVLTPAEAREFAARLVAKADEAEKQETLEQLRERYKNVVFLRT